MKRGILGVLLYCSVVSTRGEENSSCGGSQLRHQAASFETMMNAAARCNLPDLARIASNRAYFYELMQDYSHLNRALSADKGAQAYYEAYRIFIGLAEAFAFKAIVQGDVVALVRLNETYRQYIEITELRLKGYDLIANRLERELRF